jgi:VanZ family protein
MIAPRSSSLQIKRLVLIVCVLAWVGAFVATHIPVESLPKDLPGSDKTLHLVGYGALGLIFWLTLRVHSMGIWRRIVTVMIVLTVYGLFDEATQPLVNRDFAWSDWLADIVGAALAVAGCETINALLTPLFRRRAT